MLMSRNELWEEQFNQIIGVDLSTQFGVQKESLTGMAIV